MPEDRDTLKLAKSVNHDACAQLSAELGNWRGRPISILADEVEQLGVLGAQLLLVAKQTWAAEDVPFEIVSPSEGFTTSAKRLGLHEALMQGEDA